jgi:23S rRNA pseudouridine955/2504/2580 synthase/23S rRNA pseudouridine1911/1915/1917 synthase
VQLKSKPVILFETDNLIAADKPSGVLSIADRKGNLSFKEILEAKFGTLYIVHRLDKDTSGIILYARNKETHQYLCNLFLEKKIEKYYTAIVHGRPHESAGMIDAPIAENPSIKGSMIIHRNGKPSQTGYQVLEANKFFSLVEFRLFTGRTHQIRVHSKNAGFPVAVDKLYGNDMPIYLSHFKKKYKVGKFEEEQPILNRLALHASRVEFTDMDGKVIKIESTIPKVFSTLMKQLKQLH